MISASSDALQQRASGLVDQLSAKQIDAKIIACTSAVGGGSLPGETLPSWAIALPGVPDELHGKLRKGKQAVIGRISDGQFLLDLRTVLPEQEAALLDAILSVYS
jgi:L-seryl-tRNA(Ser) seleniumtransferase